MPSSSVPYARGVTLTAEQRAQVWGETSPTSLETGGTIRRSRMLKHHECPVIFPDGTRGTCRYERLGPACHRFLYTYGDTLGDGTVLPAPYFLRPLGNTPAAIEEKARELADRAFSDAVERERRDYFARVSEPADGSRKKNPSGYQLKPAEVKEHGGKYALCLVIGSRLVRVSAAVKTLAEANDQWRQKGDVNLVVACCNRLDRRWEVPRYNPLHKEHNFRKRVQPGAGKEASDAVVPAR